MPRSGMPTEQGDSEQGSGEQGCEGDVPVEGFERTVTDVSRSDRVADLPKAPVKGWEKMTAGSSSVIIEDSQVP